MLVSQNSSALPGWMVGVYQGFDPIAAQRGLDLDRSRLDLVVNASSILVSSAPDVVGRQWKYKYSEAWIDQNSDFIRAHNNLMRSCLGLKGVAGGRHILCFNRLQLSTDSAEVTLHPTENPTVQLGVFFGKRKQLIESTYWSLRNAKVPFSGDSWAPYYYQIPEIDFEQADQIMVSGDRRQKNELIKKIGDQLWARGSKEIKVLIKYLNLAIHDPDPVVQVFALDVFTERHPIVQGVPLVLGVLNNPEVFPHTTVQRAASAGLSLLLQGKVVLRAESTLESLYGTSDLDDLYQKTGGVVSAEARGAIEAILRL